MLPTLPKTQLNMLQAPLVEQLLTIEASLLVLLATIRNNYLDQPKKPIKMLLDTAATTVYASKELADLYPDDYLSLPAVSITLPNGETMTSTQGLRLKYSIRSNFHDKVQARVLDLQHYDVILGMT